MKKKHFYLLILSISVLGCNITKTSNSTEKTASLTELDLNGEYKINDTSVGFEISVSIDGDKRVMKTNGLPNHQTGTFPNEGNPNEISAQSLEYSFPMTPVLSGESRWAREPGVAVNGIKFEPETAERFVCESGEQYKIEAFQELVDLGLDHNHAHVQPTGAYHYHGVPTGLIELLDQGEDIILVGFAHDGYKMYYSKSGKYKPSYRLASELRTGDACSYTNPHTSMSKVIKGTNPDGTFVSDWDYVAGLGDLDECNGIEFNGEYAYFITDDYPYIGRCLKGKFSQRGPKGPPPGSKRPAGSPPHRH